VYCARLVPVLEQVLEAFPEKVKVVHKNFPLKKFKFSKIAAVAAMAAHQQDRFWHFHDRLFENHNKLNDEKVRDIAKTLDLDMAAFDSAQKKSATISMVNRDMREGIRHGVKGTPTVFINGRKLETRDINGFHDAIKKALEKKAAALSSGPVEP